MKHSLSVLYITLICVCFGAPVIHASSEFNVTVQNSSKNSPIYYVIATTNLTGKVLDPVAALNSISPLGIKTTEKVPEAKKSGWFKKASTAPAPLPDTATTKRSKSSNRVTEYTQFFAASDKPALEKRINGDPLSTAEKKRVIVKRFPQSVKPYCTGTLSFTIKDKGIRAANPSEQAISVTSNDKGLTCTFFAPTQPAAATPTSAPVEEGGFAGFAANAARLHERIKASGN
jgi:hypothetical protein